MTSAPSSPLERRRPLSLVPSPPLASPSLLYPFRSGTYCKQHLTFFFTLTLHQSASVVWNGGSVDVMTSGTLQFSSFPQGNDALSFTFDFNGLESLGSFFIFYFYFFFDRVNRGAPSNVHFSFILSRSRFFSFTSIFNHQSEGVMHTPSPVCRHLQKERRYVLEGPTHTGFFFFPTPSTLCNNCNYLLITFCY